MALRAVAGAPFPGVSKPEQSEADLAVEYLRAVVPVMRELGVAVFGDVELGLPPAKTAVLEAQAERAAPAEQERLNKELAEERRRQRIDEARAEMRLTLAHTGRSYTDAEIDQFLGPIE